MRYYVIAGEASGDLHASNLISGLKKQDPAAEFRAWGGDLMAAQGAALVKHYRDLAFMGFMEVLLNLKTILGNLRVCRRDILEWKPDVVILVDYPGFNLRMAKFAARHHFRVFYYISPQVWAWHASRVKTIRRYVERMFVILPFEQDFYRKHHYGVDFAGHPLLDAIGETGQTAARFRSESGLGSQPLIALLPGSRKQEIVRMLPVMLQVIPLFPQYRFVVAALSSIPPECYEKIVGGVETVVVTDRTHDLLRNAAAALVTSGTATLEAALLNTPQVVCYKAGVVSYWIARMLVDVKFISLVNLIAGRQVVKELLQYDLRKENLAKELSLILEEDRSRKIREDYAELRTRLGGKGASSRIAALMAQYLQSK